MDHLDPKRCAEEFLAKIGADGDSWIPAENMERQDWQNAVEAAVPRLRKQLAQPVFGLSEPEVSIFYHRPIIEFIDLILHRAGLK